MIGRLLAGGMVFVLAPVGLLAVLGMGQSSSQASAGAAVGGLPATAVAAYRAAAGAAAERWGCTVPASLLGAIGSVESGHGTAGGAQVAADGTVAPPILGPVLDGSGAGGNVTPVLDTDGGALDGDTTYDRAVGPMQFLPETWGQFDAAVDGERDPQNMFDATLAAAWLLCGSGGARDLSDPETAADAVLAYNQSLSYLLQVTAAQELLAVLLDGSWATADVEQLLAHPGFATSPHAAADLEAGVVDPRLVGLLWTMVEDLGYQLYASPFVAGHSRCVGGGPDDQPGCSESHHWHGRAIDISVVNGAAVRATNPAARQLTDWLASLADIEELSITVGSPWGDYVEPGFFTDAAHADHLHLSVCGPRLRPGGQWSDCR